VGAASNTWLLDLSPQEIAVEYEEWIRDFCQRYPDTDLLDVVTEALPGHNPANHARRAFGNDWIVRPNSVLILEDYNVIRWETEEFIELARPVVKSGYVDAIGLQAHELEGFSAADIQRQLDYVWDKLQVPIYITQYDVALADDTEQLQTYQEQFPVFYQHPHVKGITILGYVYGKTWGDGSGLIHPDGTPRPALTWLMQYIRDNPR
jgi:GH35 family endo-1,4-beta-xylanase